MYVRMLYVCMYVCVYVSVCVYIYMYIYICMFRHFHSGFPFTGPRILTPAGEVVFEERLQGSRTVRSVLESIREAQGPKRHISISVL